MAEMYEWLKLDEDDQISFVMYGSYEEQMEYLNDEQLGRLIRNAMHYVKTGEQRSAEPIIDMMLSVMANDIRNQKRNQKKKVDAGKAGGAASVKAKAEKQAAKSETKKGTKKTRKKQEPEAGEKSLNYFEAASSSASTIVNQYVDVDEDVDKDMDVDVDVDGDVDADELLNPDCYCSRGGSTGACDDNRANDSDELMRYGENQHLTTAQTVQQTKAITWELFQRYMHETPTQHDCEKAFGYLFEFRDLDEETHYGVYSPQRAELLRHAFEVAANQNGLNWNYIAGIYDNYRAHDVYTLEEALEYEGKWNRGEIA